MTNYIATSIPIGYSLIGGRLSTTSIGRDFITIGQRLFGIKAPGKSVNVYTGWFAGHGIDNFFYYYLVKRNEENSILNNYLLVS